MNIDNNIELADAVSDFEIDISVRISDVNYGGHLGHAELIKITHQARLKFLLTNSLRENNIGGAGIIVKNLSVDYKGEAFFDETLNISIRIEEIGKVSCVFIYEIIKNSEKPVAVVRETIVFMNYEKRRPVRVPEEILALKRK